MMINKVILLFLALALSLSLSAQEKVIDKIVGKVGDKIVLLSDVEIQHQQALSQGQPSDQCSILDQLMLERLLVNQAELDSIIVSEDEIEQELDTRFQYYVRLLGSEEAFEQHFNKSVHEFKEEFRDDVSNLLMAQRMQQDVIATVSVTPSEVKSFYRGIPKDSIPYFNAAVRVSQIMIKPKLSEEEKDKAKQKLLDLKQRIESGEDPFENLAEIYSEDPGSARAGGHLGWTNRGDFVKEFEAAAFKLGKNELSGIVESKFGYHLIKLLERRGNRIKTQHILIKPAIISSDIKKTEVYADSILQVIKEKEIPFADAVQSYSEDEESRKVNGDLMNQYTGTNLFELDQLEPDIFFALDGVEVGDYSEPVMITAPDGSKTFRIFTITEKTEPHLANLEQDYDRMQQLTKVQKQNEKLKSWIARKSVDTYIELDPAYNDCEVLKKWDAVN